MKKLLMIAAMVMLVFALAACGQQAEDPGSDAQSGGAELSEEQMDSLMKQVAESDLEQLYSGVLPNCALANAEVFGIDRDKDKGTAYVFLNEAEYVALKDKAYEMSGSAGEVIIRFEYTDEGPKLSEVEWSADGSDHDKWLEENFPEEYLKACKKYDAYDGDGKSVLSKDLAKKVEEVLGVSLETENLLEVDVDKGTYEISKVIETGEGDSYSFNTETIEKGKLSDVTK